MTSLLPSIITAVLLLYVPGTFFFRALGFSRLVSLMCAPLYSFAAYSALPIAYEPLGIPCGVVSMVGPTIAIAVIAYVATRRIRASRSQIDIARSRDVIVRDRRIPFEPAALLGYVAIALIMTAVVFGSGSLAVEGFLCNSDNQTHINLVRSFIDSGKWSSLNPNLYLTSEPNAIPVVRTDRFYPCALHDLVSLVCLITGAAIVTAYNATVAALVVTLVPSCVFLFLTALFPKERRTIAAGAVVYMAFGVFPWVPLLFMGPIIPFLLGTTCALAFIAVIIVFIESKAVKTSIIAFVAFCCVSAIALVLTQTSALFTAYLFLGVYACHLLSSAISSSRRIDDRKKQLVRILSVGGLAIALAVIFVTFYHLPFLSNIVNYPARKYMSLQSALLRLFSLALTIGKPQMLLALLVGVGLYGCYKTKRLWLVVPVAYMWLAYIGISVSSEPFRSLEVLAGFWYNNYHRIAIHYALFLMPITAIGTSYIMKWIMAAIARLARRPLAETARTALACTVAAAMFIAVVPLSGANMYKRIQSRATSKLTFNENQAYARSEFDFVNRVMEVIPDGALVLNAPYDGSVFSYGMNGLNTYIRKLEPKKLTEDAKLISSQLPEYTTNEDVRRAVENVGADYVMLLDRGVAYEDGTWLTKGSKTNYQTWANMSAIDDDTPGFEVVLAEGDMRLYRIVPQ